MGVEKVVSGGQTGVDRAGLDVALEIGIPVGGYCPCGRKAEDGVIPARYPLVELSSDYYCTRTEQNVVESDGTLILNKGELSEGTGLTREFALQHGKPCLVVQLDDRQVLEPSVVADWITDNGIAILNVAGPRESKYPGGIYQDASRYLRKIFRLVIGNLENSESCSGAPHDLDY